jgi:hypothetical protein
VFMLVTAWLQLSWAVAAIAKPSRLLLWGGIVLNLGIVGVYIVTRTVGDVIGPTPHDVEPFGFGDGLCTVLEALVAVGCAWLLVSKSEQRVQRHRLVLASGMTGAFAAILLSIALVDGGSEMVMGMGDATVSASPVSAVHNTGSTMKMHMAASKSSVDLANATPAGRITMPNANMQMAPGMSMASATPCTTSPTAAQQRAAVSWVNRSWKGAQKFRSLAAAKAAGYQAITPSGRAVVHYVNPYYLQATWAGNSSILNTAEPQSLVYANTPKGAVLVASMYITKPGGGATPQPGGCLTQWHFHTNLCLNGITVVGVVGKTHTTCPAGSSNFATPPMMHVWYVPIPGGPTAIDAPDAQVVHAAERVKAPANGTA